MVNSRAGLTPFSAALGSKQLAFVTTAAVSSRVRRRECSSALQQAPAAAARRQLLTATTDFHGAANGAATIRGRLTARSVRVSSRSNNEGSGGNEVYTSRNRMMAAAKRRRWTEVCTYVTRLGARENVVLRCSSLSPSFDLMLVRAAGSQRRLAGRSARGKRGMY